MMAEHKLVDALGRPIRDLRISVTDRCNFRCRYCMPEEIFGPDYSFLPRSELLTFEEIVRVVRIFKTLGVKKIRLTGGEPLLRKNIDRLVTMLRSIEGLDDIALTTNGSLLKRLAKPLKEAGLVRINVSLDTLDDNTFAALNSRRHSISDVLEGIEAAANVGLQVKINMVVIKGVNDHEIVPLARHFRGTGHIVRFIEYMDVGNSNGWRLDQVVSKQEIIERIHAEMPLEPIEPNYFGEVASRFRYRGSDEEIGVIASVTESFCATCTRIRLSADGKLFTCLFASEGTDIRGLLRTGSDDEQLRAFISDVWKARTDRYSDERMLHTNNRLRKKIEMSYIGG